MKIVISSGHGKYVRGASGYIDEVDEARKVVNRVVEILKEAGVEATPYHDDVSHSQSENLNRIVDFHNSRSRDWDVSVHFNAYQTTSKPMGSEVLYVSSTGQQMADKMVDAICSAGGFINRGPKKRTDLAFLNGTNEPAILIETCFVDSSADTSLYKSKFEAICGSIAGIFGGGEVEEPIGPPPVTEPLFYAKGKCSWFGGPDDTGVSPSEGLAFIYEVDTAPHLFLPKQPPGTTGLARRLNPVVSYIACRWDYNVTSKQMLASGKVALVKSVKSGIGLEAFPADWGPHSDTSRIADLSPGLMDALNLKTDDEVEVTYPYDEPEVA
jgi:N-acetylmuramoyl-L-alanine amidase